MTALSHLTVLDLTLTAVLSLMGPNARTLIGRVGAADTFAALGPEQLAFAATREIDLGFARVRAARMSYVGGPGYELYVPIEMARHVWLALHAASDGLGPGGGGLADAGYYALDALPIEAGRRAWGAELGPDETPLEAGTMFAVKLGKRDAFIGKAALLRLLDEPLRKKLVTAMFDSGAHYAWGNEPLPRRRAGRRDHFGRLERRRRALRRPLLRARRRGGARPQCRAADRRSLG